jgi:hypothetical protein
MPTKIISFPNLKLRVKIENWSHMQVSELFRPVFFSPGSLAANLVFSILKKKDLFISSIKGSGSICPFSYPLYT